MAKRATRVRRYFARGRSSRRRNKITVPMAIVAGFLPTGVGIWNRRSSGQAIGDFLQAGWTGMTPGTTSFSLGNLRLGLFPALAGFAVHMVASRLGMNRAIARAGIPLLRI